VQIRPNLLLIMHCKLPSSAKKEQTFNQAQSVDSEHNRFDHEKDTVHVHQSSSKI
jgi:hypothetical protein